MLHTYFFFCRLQQLHFCIMSNYHNRDSLSTIKTCRKSYEEVVGSVRWHHTVDCPAREPSLSPTQPNILLQLSLFDFQTYASVVIRHKKIHGLEINKICLGLGLKQLT